MDQQAPVVIDRKRGCVTTAGFLGLTAGVLGVAGVVTSLLGGQGEASWLWLVGLVSGAGLVGGYVLAWGRSLVVVDREEGEVRRVWGAPGWWRQVAVPLDQFTHVAIVRERVSGHAPGRPDYLFRVQLAGAAPLELRVEATYEQARALAVPVAEALDWELVTR